MAKVDEEDEYYDTASRGGGIPRVFVGAPYQRGHGIGSFLGGLFRKVLPYLTKGMRAVGKEALRTGINVIEDVENNTPLKVALRNRFEESRGNLKRKAEEKISSLMKGSGYKLSAKTSQPQFPFSILDSHLATKSASRKRRRRRQPAKKKSSSRSSTRRRKNTKRLKKKRRPSGRKTKKSSVITKRLRGKKRSVSDIFS